MSLTLFYCSLTFQTLIVLVSGCSRFTKTPPSVLYVNSGETVKFEWDYYVDDRDKEFDVNSPQWSYYDTKGRVNTIASEDAFNGWKWTIHYSTCPPRLLNPTRIRKESKASLVISNVSTADTGSYECSLLLIKTSHHITSQVRLVVSDSTVLPNRTNSKAMAPITLLGVHPTAGTNYSSLLNVSKLLLNQDYKNVILYTCEPAESIHQLNSTDLRYCPCESVKCTSKVENSNPTALYVSLIVAGLSVLLNVLLFIKIKFRRPPQRQGVVKDAATVRFGPTRNVQDNVIEEESIVLDSSKSSSDSCGSSTAVHKLADKLDHTYEDPDDVKAPEYSEPILALHYQSLSDHQHANKQKYQCLLLKTKTAKSSQQSPCNDNPHVYEPLGCDHLMSIYEELDQVIQEKKQIL